MMRRALVLAAPAAAVFALSLWLTRPPGPGLTPDGMSYLGAGESWARGRGLRIPWASWSDRDSTSALTHFPPAFPVAIGLTTGAGLSAVQGGRLLIALAAATTAATLAWLLMLAGSSLAAAIGAIAVLLIPAIVADHVALLSEPLFLAALALTLASMIRFTDRPWSYGLLAAACVALRYAGVAVTATVVLWCLMQPGDSRGRWRRAAVAALPSVIFLFAWITRLRWLTGAVTHRSLTIAFPFAAARQEVRDALTASLAPSLEDTGWGVPVAALVASLAAAAVVRRTRRLPLSAAEKLLFRSLALAAACYLAMIALARILVGHDIPFDDRILSPALMMGATAVAAAMPALWRSLTAAPRVVTVLLASAWIAGAGLSARALDADVHANGYDYGSLAWRRSPTVAWLKDHASANALFTNQPVPIFYGLGRPARDLPTSLDPDTLRAFAAALRAQRGVLVAFSDTSWQPGARAADVAAALRLNLAARLPDGTIWTATGP